MKLGDIITVYGFPCRIIRFRPMGTIDVERIDADKAYRLSGFAVMTKKELETANTQS